MDNMNVSTTATTLTNEDVLNRLSDIQNNLASQMAQHKQADVQLASLGVAVLGVGMITFGNHLMTTSKSDIAHFFGDILVYSGIGAVVGSAAVILTA